MATTLTTLLSNLRDELKIDPNGKIWSDGELTRMINDAYLQVQIDGSWNFPGNEGTSGTVAITAGTQEYSLPTDIGMIEIMFLGTTELHKDTFVSLKRRNTTNSQGTPSDYYIRGNKVGFDPIPNSSDTVTIYYKKRLTDLADGSDAIGLDDLTASLIMKYAAYLAWSSPRGNRDSAIAKYEDYKLAKNRVFAALLLRDMNDLHYGSPRESYSNNFPKRIP